MKKIVILGASNQGSNLNYESIRRIYSSYRGKFVSISFKERSLRLNNTVASHTNSEYENPKELEGANYLNDPNIDVHVDVAERSFGISIPAKKTSKKDQLWITLQNEKLAQQLQFKLGISKIIGHLSLHQFIANAEEMPTVVYKEKIEKLYEFFFY